MTAHARSLPALLALLTATATHARADAPTDPVPWEDCDACSQRDWVLAEPGTGPEIGPLARLELGTAGLGVDDGAGGAASRCSRSSAASGPSNGRAPASSSWAMTPNA